MTKTEVEALINLLNDPDESVYQAVKNKCLDLGGEVLPLLRLANSTSNNGVFIRQSSEIIAQVEFEHTFGMLKKWLQKNDNNILEGAFWVAKYIYPELEYAKLTKKIDEICDNNWIEQQQQLTELERVNVLNHILYKIYKYDHHQGNMYEYRNICINKVIDSKHGSPVALAILYIAVARKLGMRVFGVNLPQNFLVAHIYPSDNKPITANNNKKEVMFYTNPHQYGAILTKREIEDFIKRQKMQKLPQFFEPCTDKIAIQRLLLNLFITCTKQRDTQKIKDIKLFLKEFKNKLPDYNL